MAYQWDFAFLWVLWPHLLTGLAGTAKLWAVALSCGLAIGLVVGIFRTGNASVDETQTFTLLKRAQVMFERPNRVNRFLIQLDDAYAAREVAQRIEGAIGDKSVRR